MAHLVTLGSDRINLINEDNRRRVLLRFFESLPQIRFTLSRHLRHDLRTVNKEEESTSLVGDGASHESFSGSRRTKHQDTTRRLDTDRLEELRVTEGKFDEFTNLSELFAATSDIVVSNVGQIVLFVFTLDGFSLGVDDSVLCDDTVLGGIGFDYLEFDTSSSSLGKESVSLSYWSVSFEEVRLEEYVEDVTGETCEKGDREYGERGEIREIEENSPSMESSKGRT